MRRLLLVILLALVAGELPAQEENSTNLLIPPPEWTVQSHKEQLRLTLFIDSIQIGGKVSKLNFQRTLNLSYESDYLQIKDDFYIKIFIARNQEYGKKFYSWKWAYLKRQGNNYGSLGINYYAPMNFGQPIANKGSYGQGIGYEGEADYLMYWYRYKLE